MKNIRLMGPIHDVIMGGVAMSFMCAVTKSVTASSVHEHSVVHDTTRFRHAMFDRYVYVVNIIEISVLLTQDRTCSNECFLVICGLWLWQNNQMLWWIFWSHTDPCTKQDRQDHDPIAAGSFMESDRIKKSWAGEKLLIRSLYHSDWIVYGFSSHAIDLVFQVYLPCSTPEGYFVKSMNCY